MRESFQPWKAVEKRQKPPLAWLVYHASLTPITCINEGELYAPFNPIALRMAKTLWSFGHSESNRVKEAAVREVEKTK